MSNNEEIIITIKIKGNEVEMSTNSNIDTYRILNALELLEKDLIKKIETNISEDFKKMTGHENIVNIEGVQDIKNGKVTKRYKKE